MHFQGVAFGFFVPAVKQLHQVIASHDPARRRKQFVEQFIFLGRQRHRLALIADLLGAGVQADAGVFDQHLGAPGAASQQRPQASLEFGQVEGLDQVVVGPGIQPGDAVFGGIPGGEDQYRQVGAAFTQATQHLQTVHARQAEIEHGQVKRLAEQ